MKPRIFRNVQTEEHDSFDVVLLAGHSATLLLMSPLFRLLIGLAANINALWILATPEPTGWLDRSANWSLNIPAPTLPFSCLDYWGRVHYRRTPKCMYFFHGQFTNGTVKHYLHYNQDLDQLRRIAESNNWEVWDLVEQCANPICVGTCSSIHTATSRYVIGIDAVEYFTLICCESPGCYGEPHTDEEALHYPQSLFGAVLFSHESEARNFTIEQSFASITRPKEYYLGSQKPLTSGVDENVAVRFGQDDEYCGLGNGNGSTAGSAVRIAECAVPLLEHGKCFSVCISKPADTNENGFWAVDIMLLEMVKTAQRREQSRCVAYGETDGCVVIRDPITGEFFSDQIPNSPKFSFFRWLEEVNNTAYNFLCSLSTHEPLRPKVVCTCNGSVDEMPCDAYMYSREEVIFDRMYDGDWSRVADVQSHDYTLWKPSCPTNEGRMVFMCEITFVLENGALKNSTLPVDLQRLKKLRKINFTGYANDSYFCGEEATETEIRIVCVCPVRFGDNLSRGCNKEWDFPNGASLALIKGGRTVKDLNRFEDDLKKCLRESPTNADRQTVVDYVSDFLCYFVQRTSNTGVGRLVGHGVYTKNSQLPEFPIIRVLCDRKRILSMHLINRGCLCGYYFYGSLYRFLICCCLPRALDSDLDRSIST